MKGIIYLFLFSWLITSWRIFYFEYIKLNLSFISSLIIAFHLISKFLVNSFLVMYTMAVPLFFLFFLDTDHTALSILVQMSWQMFVTVFMVYILSREIAMSKERHIRYFSFDNAKLPSGKFVPLSTCSNSM